MPISDIVDSITRVARSFLSRTTVILAALALLMAGLLVLARVLFAAVPNYHADVEHWLSHVLGQQLSIGRLDADWRGWTPVLRLRDVSLFNEDGGIQLRLQEMHVEARLESLFEHGRLELGTIRLVGAKLSMLRQPDGRFALLGLEGLNGIGPWPAWLVTVREVALVSSEVTLQDRRSGAPPLYLEDVDLRLASDGMRHRLKGAATLPRSMGERVELAADLKGPWGTPARWHGEVYVKGANLRPDGWTYHWPDSELRVLDGRIGFELWGLWSDRRLEHLDGMVRAEHLWLARNHLAPEARSKPVGIRHLSALLHWKNKGSDWNLDVERLQLRLGEASWPAVRLQIVHQATPQSSPSFNVAVSYLRLNELAPAIQRLVAVQSPWSEALAALRPKGEVHDLRLRLHPQSQRVAAEARLSGLSWKAWRRIPVVEGVSGRIHGNEHAGMLELDSTDAMVYARELFAGPLVADELRGVVRWHRDPAGLRVASDQLLASNEDVKTRSRFAFLFPADGGSPFLDLQSAFTGPTAVRAPHYVPQRVFGAKLNRWLSQAFRGGRVPAGDVLFYGRFEDFPFARGDGIFEVRFDTAAATLNYKGDWPRAENLSAQVLFRNQTLRITARTGQLFDTRVRMASATIADLRRPELRVRVEAEGPVSDLLRYLRESPLKERYSRFLTDSRSQGESALALNLRIPLVGGKEPQIDGQVTLRGSTLAWENLGLELEDLNGRLDFSGQGLACEGIRGYFLGRPIQIHISTKEELGPQPTWTTRLQASGTMDVATLKRQYATPFLDYLEGETQWDLSLQVPSGAGREDLPLRARLASELLGLGVRAPSPLGKTAQERRPLVIRTHLSAAAEQRLEIDYGETVLGDLRLVKAGEALRPERLVVRFGEARAAAPREAGVYLLGRLPTLDAVPWLELGMKAQDLGDSVLPSLSIDMRIDRLQALAQTLHDATLRLRRTESGFEGAVDSRELKGVLRLPVGQGLQEPLEIHLEHASLLLSQDATSGAGWDPRRVPPLRVTAKHFKVEDIDLGALELETVRVTRGQHLKRLILRSDAFVANATGKWVVATGAQQSDFELRLKGDSLSGVLQRLGFASNVKGGRTEIQASGRWPGGVNQFSLRQLVGSLQFDIYKGRFLDLEPGVGRVFGLLSLETLLRRLSLDFSDLFKKGYSFDRIKGVFTLDSGDAYTQTFFMDGPSSRVEIAGRIGLVSTDYDQTATVIPKITASLPIAGALAGGPAVGGALLLAQRLFGKKIDKITGLHYTITGPWEKPNIERQRKRLLSPLLQGVEPTPAEDDAGSELESWEVVPWSSGR